MAYTDAHTDEIASDKELIAYCRDGMVATMDIRFLEISATHCEAVMPITPAIAQPFGFVHGGATLTLLETVASRAAVMSIDPDAQKAFGIHIDVRHKKSGKAGSVRGVADLDHVEGRRQIWNVAAYDDEGDVMSEGIFETIVVSNEYLAEKERRRQEQERA